MGERPRIGIAFGDATCEGDSSTNIYARYVEAAGGAAVPLCPRDGRGVDGLDGLVLSGGLDVEPRRYGEEVDPAAGVQADPARDAYELPLAQAALDRGLPVLGICRGFQLLNVLAGGKLIQDLPGHREGVGSDMPSTIHDVRVEPGTRVGDLLGGPTVRVNSRHHQGVAPNQVAPGLRAVAWSPGDDLVEALEAPTESGHWVVAVQWHPERVDECDPACQELARGLVQEARRRAGSFNRAGSRPPS